MTALDDLVEDMAALLDAPCTLEDRDFRLLGFSDQREAGAVDNVRQRSILERGSTNEVREWFLEHGVDRAEGPTRTPPDPDRGITARLCVPAIHAGTTYAYFWLLDPDECISPSLLPEAERIAANAAAMLSFAEQKQASRDELYEQLIRRLPGAGRHHGLDTFAAAGLAHDKPLQCILLSGGTVTDQLLRRTPRPGVFWARHTDDVVAVLCRPGVVEPDQPTAEIVETLGLGRRTGTAAARIHIGFGPRAASIDDLPQAHAGAQVALRVASVSGESSVMDWGRLGPLALLGVAPDEDLAWAVLPAQVRSFLAAASPDLVVTVQTFLDEAGSVSRTSARLSVHRQTIYHRLAQVERLTGLRMDVGEDRLRLHLALRMARFLT